MSLDKLYGYIFLFMYKSLIPHLWQRFFSNLSFHNLSNLLLIIFLINEINIARNPLYQDFNVSCWIYWQQLVHRNGGMPLKVIRMNIMALGRDESVQGEVVRGGLLLSFVFERLFLFRWGHFDPVLVWVGLNWQSTKKVKS